LGDRDDDDNDNDDGDDGSSSGHIYMNLETITFGSDYQFVQAIIVYNKFAGIR